MSDGALRSLTVTGLAFALFYVFSQPVDAADLTRRSLSTAENGGDALVTFVETLSSHNDATVTAAG